jgi:hypothetical protein
MRRAVRFVLLSVLTTGTVLGRIVDFGWTGSEIPMSCMRTGPKVWWNLDLLLDFLALVSNSRRQGLLKVWKII